MQPLPLRLLSEAHKESGCTDNLVNFDMVEKFVEDPEKEYVLLIDILADSLNYGYSSIGWRSTRPLASEFSLGCAFTPMPLCADCSTRSTARR